MRISRGIVVVAAVLSVVSAGFTPTAKANELFLYFPETGHYVDGVWLDFFNAHGGKDVLGAPRTEDYYRLNRLAQYFQTIRLEWDCGADGKQTCILHPGTLGEEVTGMKVDLTPDRLGPGVQTADGLAFSETNHFVRGDFLTLFDKLGGLDFFGYPLTDQEQESGNTVQWFQRAKMELSPDGQVRLAPIGDYYIDVLQKVPLVDTLRYKAPETPPAALSGTLSGEIAYRTDEGIIVVVNADGSNPRQITTGEEPALSPDGTRVAFCRTGGEQPGIWLYDLRTGTESRIITDYEARSPVWSADGQRIAYVKAKRDPVRRNDPVTRRAGWALEDHYQVANYLVDSGTVIDVPSRLYSSYPSFSPDGKQLVFDGNDAIYIVPSDGSGEPVPVSDTHRTFTQPAWSPDGKWIAGAYKRNDNYELAIIGADGSNFQLLTDSPYMSRQSNSIAPVWSPDGSRIIFLSDREGAWKLYVIDVKTKVVSSLPGQDLGINFNFKDERAVSWIG
jgi:hypothetical protein